MFWSSVSTDAAGGKVRKAPSRENIKGIRETRYGAGSCNCPFPSSPPSHLELFISLFPLRGKEARLWKKVQELTPRECIWLLLSKEILSQSFNNKIPPLREYYRQCVAILKTAIRSFTFVSAYALIDKT